MKELLRASWPSMVTGLGCAVVVCLAGWWPRPTLYVLGIIVLVVCVAGTARPLIGGRKSGTTPQEPEVTGTSAERCCVCGGPDTPYENYLGQPFCWPCADCPCDQVPCVRTGINDPAVSTETAAQADLVLRLDPTEPHAGGHSPAGGTFWHSGPRDGCTAPGCRPDDTPTTDICCVCGGRQPYPTQWAYEHAVAALRKHQGRADTAEALIKRVRDLVEPATRNVQAPAARLARRVLAALDGTP